MVVEDNPLIQRVLQHQFEALNCRVETADTAAQAFQKVKAHRYQLIILDLGLPDKNGCGLAIEIQQWQTGHDQNTPMVALSAHVNAEQTQRCYQAGMVQVLIKPLTQQQALDLLNLIIHSPANQKSYPDQEQKDKPHEKY